jgi:hypothetical protein
MMATALVTGPPLPSSCPLTPAIHTALAVALWP